MPNTIALAEIYQPLLDEVYAAESKTAILDAGSTKVRYQGGNKIEVFKYSAMDGLGTYSRATGFPAGTITAAWEAMTMSADRGKTFSVDAMDNEETLGMAFGNLAAEFLRTKVVPEIDAYRFSKYAAAVTPTSLGSTNILAAIDTAMAARQDAEVPNEGNILFVSPTQYKALKGSLTRSYANENGISRLVETLDGMPVIVVPQGRFYSAITLSATSGYTKASGAANLAFAIIHPSAVVQVKKHEVPRIFSPEVNQAADAWKFDYRMYHDAFVMDQKVNGITVYTV